MYKIWSRGFPTRMVYLHYTSCLRYTILVGNPGNITENTFHHLRALPRGQTRKDSGQCCKRNRNHPHTNHTSDTVTSEGMRVPRHCVITANTHGSPRLPSLCFQYPRRRNVTTSVVGLTTVTYAKISPKNGEPERHSWGT